MSALHSLQQIQFGLCPLPNYDGDLVQVVLGEAAVRLDDLPLDNETLAVLAEQDVIECLQNRVGEPEALRDELVCDDVQ